MTPPTAHCSSTPLAQSQRERRSGHATPQPPRAALSPLYQLGALILCTGSLLVLLGLFVLPFYATDTIQSSDGAVIERTSQTGVEYALNSLDASWTLFFFLCVPVTVLLLYTGVGGLVRRLPRSLPVLCVVLPLLAFFVALPSFKINFFSRCFLECPSSPTYKVSYFDVAQTVWLIGFLVLPILGGILMAATSNFGVQGRSGNSSQTAN